VVNGISLEVKGGEVVGLLGPNGAGKTTTFHMMVGLIQPDEGKVLMNDDDLTGAPIHQRARAGISYLPQESSVFRRLTVEENLRAILQTLDLSAVEQQERADALMKMLGVTHLATHKALTLSGGERRRVEIARALVLSPYFLLLDEPYRALDSLTKSVMHEALLEIFYKNRVTIFFITHDLEEAIFLGHRVVIMTTRPCRPKKILDIDIPHPRDYSVLTTKRFRAFMEETSAAVHEEAIKAFDAGEKER